MRGTSFGTVHTWRMVRHQDRPLMKPVVSQDHDSLTIQYLYRISEKIQNARIGRDIVDRSVSESDQDRMAAAQSDR